MAHAPLGEIARESASNSETQGRIARRCLLGHPVPTGGFGKASQSPGHISNETAINRLRCCRKKLDSLEADPANFSGRSASLSGHPFQPCELLRQNPVDDWRNLPGVGSHRARCYIADSHLNTLVGGREGEFERSDHRIGLQGTKRARQSQPLIGISQYYTCMLHAPRAAVRPRESLAKATARAGIHAEVSGVAAIAMLSAPPACWLDDQGVDRPRVPIDPDATRYGEADFIC